jgi:hypothetical protein
MVGLASLLAVLAAAPAGVGSLAAEAWDPRPEPAEPPPVILITVDGVRPQEVFRGIDAELAGEPVAGPQPLLPRLQARAAREGFLTGDADAADPFPIGNPAACSLPGYQVILAGRDLGCRDNDCGPLPVESVLERASRELGLGAREVAAFASWPGIALALERSPGSLTVNVGFAPFQAPFAPWDEATEALGREQVEDRPPWPNRRDRYTWALALRYLERFHPRVLYVGLGDPDEWAHLGEYRAYAGSVADLDERLEALFASLAGLGGYGAGASVLVTTDHGRGLGAGWENHGPADPGSERAWLFASTPATRARPATADAPVGRGRYDQRSIRPTLEALLGLAPCDACAPPIAELLPGTP